MKIAHTLVVGTCLVLLAAAGPNVLAPRPTALREIEKWDYLYSEFSGPDQTWRTWYGNGEEAPYKVNGARSPYPPSILGVVGKEGWELVSWDENLFKLIFKRRGEP